VTLNFPVARKHHICWGQDGLTYYGEFFNAIVIVDILSFSTTVDIALSKGCSVIPTEIEKEDQLFALAKEYKALLTKKRNDIGVTSSPSSMQILDYKQPILLPSPNGSTLVDRASRLGKPVFTGCFRNAAFLTARLNFKEFFPVLFVAAGERYSNKSLRPSIEDYWGVGSILANLQGEKTLEADSCIQSFTSASRDLRNKLLACESGQELVLRGFREDVELAAEYNISNNVSLLTKINGCSQLIAEMS